MRVTDFKLGMEVPQHSGIVYDVTVTSLPVVYYLYRKCYKMPLWSNTMRASGFKLGMEVPLHFSNILIAVCYVRYDVTSFTALPVHKMPIFSETIRLSDMKLCMENHIWPGSNPCYSTFIMYNVTSSYGTSGPQIHTFARKLWGFCLGFLGSNFKQWHLQNYLHVTLVWPSIKVNGWWWWGRWGKFDQ